jgi:CRP-like cAMP-binding protein
MGSDVTGAYHRAPCCLFTGMRNGDSVADALGRTARYGKCARRERQAISRSSTLLDVPAGAVLAREGTLHRQFVIVLAGAATVRRAGRVKSALLAGDHFGDVDLLEHGPNSATVVAETPMKIAVVGPTEFDALLERSPAVAKAVLGTLAAQVRTAGHRRGSFSVARSGGSFATSS